MRECPTCKSCFPDSTNHCPHDGNATKPTFSFNVFLKDRYQLVRRIGHRSVSAVYFARDAVNNSECAIKIILPETIGDNAPLAERFLVEATATSTIPHPNIVGVTDSGILDGLLPFIVMEFIAGTNLHDELAGKQALAPSQALHYMLPICSGLAIAHRRDIVHGDLKPRTILIGDNPDVVKVSDFGMSLLKAGNLDGGEAKSSSMLRSPLYLAPEVWSEEETDARSDIYSLGVILYQLLTGDVPFKGKSIPAIMKQHLINLPPAIAGNNGVSAELEEVVMHALAKNPEERPATVEEFVEELQFVVGDGGTATIVRPKSAAVVKEKREGTAQSFAGDTTLADHRIEDTIVAPPVDMDKTIVLSRTDLRSMRSSIIEEEQTSTSVGPTNFDMTIVPGMVKQTIFESRPVEIEVALPEVCDQPLPVGNEEPEDELQEEPEDSTFSEVPYDEPPPRTISPVLLAIGVFLIVVLIGVGVYYSRTID